MMPHETLQGTEDQGHTQSVIEQATAKVRKTCIEIVREWLSPDDARRTFSELRVPGEKWRSCGWLQETARLTPTEGGISKSLKRLTYVIRDRFGSFPQFIAWMDGREETDSSSRIQLNIIPANPTTITPALVGQIEQALHSPIEKIPIVTRDPPVFTITVEGHSYRDRAPHLFYRIANRILGVSPPSHGRQYLQLIRDGVTPEEAIAQIKLNVLRKPNRTPSLDVSFWTPQFVSEIERVMGKPIMQLSTKDHAEFRFRLGGIEYKDCARNLFSRIRDSILHTTSIADGKRYLEMIKRGMKHKDAVRTITKRARRRSLNVDHLDRNTSLPVDPTVLNADVIRAIECVLGKSIAQISAKDTSEFSVTVAGKHYVDRPVNLFDRIAYNLFEQRARTRARAYLALIRDGCSHKDALEQAAGIEGLCMGSRRTRNVLCPRKLSATFVLQIEQQCRQPIEAIPLTSDIKLSIDIEGTRYVGTPHSLFEKIAVELFASHAGENGRGYLAFIKQCMESDKAIEIIQKSLVRRTVSQSPIPADLALFSPATIALIEQELGDTIERLSCDDNAVFTVSIQGEQYQERLRSLCMRLARHMRQSDNPRLGWMFLVLRKHGMGPEGIQSFQDAQALLDIEIVRLKRLGALGGGSENPDEVTQQDRDTFLRGKYRKNIVLQEVLRYCREHVKASK